VAVRFFLARIWLHVLQARDRMQLRALARRHPGLEIHPTASTNFAWAEFDIEPGGKLRIGPHVTCERVLRSVRFRVAAGAEIEIGERTWLRGDIAPIYLVAWEGARLTMGPGCWLQGCHVSAKDQVTLGRQVMIGFGCRVFDSAQHAIDDTRPERTAPVTLGDCVWLTSDTTVLKGVRIGEHSVIASRSVVMRSIPPHSLAGGNPAEPKGYVGDRWKSSGIPEPG
jgi:acetyltransferase-like isoleucine patch superfamily enzyme